MHYFHNMLKFIMFRLSHSLILLSALSLSLQTSITAFRRPLLVHLCIHTKENIYAQSPYHEFEANFLHSKKILLFCVLLMKLHTLNFTLFLSCHVAAAAKLNSYKTNGAALKIKSVQHNRATYDKRKLLVITAPLYSSHFP